MVELWRNELETTSLLSVNTPSILPSPKESGEGKKRGRKEKRLSDGKATENGVITGLLTRVAAAATRSGLKLYEIDAFIS